MHYSKIEMDASSAIDHVSVGNEAASKFSLNKTMILSTPAGAAGALHHRGSSHIQDLKCQKKFIFEQYSDSNCGAKTEIERPIPIEFLTRKRFKGMKKQIEGYMYKRRNTRDTTLLKGFLKNYLGIQYDKRYFHLDVEKLTIRYAKDESKIFH